MARHTTPSRPSLRRSAALAAPLLALALLTPLLGLAAPKTSADTGRLVMRARIKSIVHPISSEFIVDAVQEADAAGAAALVIELDTPGGLIDSTREITTAILGAKTPVVVFVAPSGAQAASAGFFILISADVAAMAPGTNTGAAHPVGGEGEDDRRGRWPRRWRTTRRPSSARCAAARGRNVELAEEAVRESLSFTAEGGAEKGSSSTSIAPDLSPSS